MENILKLKHYSKLFFSLVICLLSILILIKFFVIPYFYPTKAIVFVDLIISITDNLLSSFIVTIFIGVFIYMLTPKIMQKSMMEIVEPKQISPLLQNAAKSSRNWIFKGAGGRYTRAQTLPLMAESARHEGIGRDIKLFLINPDNQVICNEYAIYRKSLKSGKKQDWDINKVKNEVLATIIKTLIIKHEEPLLRIEIYLLDFFSTFRYDISDDYAIITKEDKEVSALKVDSGTYYYDSYIDELRLNERLAKKIEPINMREINIENINNTNLLEFISNLNIIENITTITDDNLSYIVKSIKESKNPYK